nr:uncharacterized protein LOC120967226 [Aegilops tauschii subsp. strangulata]XP_040249780.2 uncharacterized protein LOC120967228 [Aegilops tauschii subsp. strangulata]XP_045086459.1 uncharacterized protein LOC120967224 [Aegilops tauschii subsp. strangulata]
MSTESRNGSDIDPENVIAVTLDDLSEDDRRELEQEIKKEMAERLKLKLTGYRKTSIGVVKKVQSAINEERLTFTESSKMKLDSDAFPINVVKLESKKMLIRSDQTEFARKKNAVDDNASPRMIKQKNPEVGVWKVNGRRKQAPRPKPPVSMLLEKYTSRKTSNVFNRLGDNKRLRSPSGPGGHEQWQRNLYDQQPYIAMEPTYWVVHLLCTRSFLHGVLILGCHILQCQVIFTQNGFCRGLCSEQTYMRKGLGSMRQLDHVMQLLSKGTGHWYGVHMVKFI